MVARDVDGVVAVVFFFCLETQPEVGTGNTCGNCLWEKECSPLTFCGMTSQNRTCRARGRSG